jgi:hypothetical protein
MNPGALAGISAGAGGLLGGVAGAIGSKERQQMNVSLPDLSAFEQRLAGVRQGQAGEVEQAYDGVKSLLGMGPGAGDVQAGYNSQLDLAALLKKFSMGGFIPEQNDINTANTFAGQMFQPQQIAMQQAFQDQRMMGNRAMAKMGRGPGDPIMMNKLAQEETRQQAMLGAQQGQFASQFAMNMPTQRLQYAQDHSNLMSGLASQALANRQALLSMGSNLQQAERSYRLGAANREVTNFSGGGFGGFFAGAAAGAGSGLKAGGAFSGLDTMAAKK